MKILVVTNLFPNSKEPCRGIFNFQQIRHLADKCEIRVIAPLPWVPPFAMFRNRYSYSSAPRKEVIDGLPVTHPRYLALPKVGRSLHGICLFLGLLLHTLHIRKDFPFQLILATWAYPDGFAASLIGMVLRKPVIIKVHGSDINISCRNFFRKALTLFGLSRASRVIAVSRALKKELIKMGLGPEKVSVVYNGVNKDLFFPRERLESKKELGIPLNCRVILFVGKLEPVKGVTYLVEAFHKLRLGGEKDLLLILIGQGPLREAIQQRIKELNIDKCVLLLGNRPHEELPVWMGVADVFCLPSLNEGIPNVVLEALSAGRPVVATAVGGIPEIINSEDLGLLVCPQDIAQLADSLLTALKGSWDPLRIADLSKFPSWSDSARGILKEVEKAVGVAIGDNFH